MSHISVHRLLNSQRVIELGGDLLLLPRYDPIPVEPVRSLELAGTMPKSTEGAQTLANMLDFLGLQDAYAAERSAGDEPPWVAALPIAVRKHLRTTYAVQEEATQIVFDLPHTGISYAIKDDGLCFDLARACNLFRLDGIRQLGYLRAPAPTHDIIANAPLSESTRYAHSIDVMAIATVMAQNLGLTGTMFATTRAAGLLHDMGTPAGGDSVKMIDPRALDEDLNFPKLLARHDVSAILAKHGINRKLLCEAILNRGIAGEILDIADKLAYVGRDLFQTLHHIKGGAYIDLQPGLKTLARLLEYYPLVCSIWDAVELQDGHVVFTDPGRLGAFLRVRTLMFRELYYHPRARFGEFLVSRLLVKALYRRKIVTIAGLVEMADYELERLMESEYGTGPFSIERLYATPLARARSFEHIEDAHAFMATLRADGNVFCLLDDDRRAIKTGTKFLVRGQRFPHTFKEACPDDAAEIEEMAALYPMVHVYYLDGEPSIESAKLEELRKALSEDGAQA